MTNSFKNNLVHTIVTKVPISILTLLSIVFLTRALGPEGNGIYSYIMTNVSLAVMVLGFNISTPLLYFGANKEIELKKLKAIGLVIVVFSTFVYSLIFLFFKLFYPSGLNFFLPSVNIEIYLIVFLLLSYLFTMSSVLFDSLLKGSFLFKKANNYQIVVQTINTLSYALMLYLFVQRNKSTSFEILFYWILITQAIATLYLAVKFFSNLGFGINFKNIKGDFNKFMKYASQIYLNTISSFINKRIDIWFVEFYKGVSMLGIYSLATSVTNFMLQFLNPANQVLMTHFSKKNENNLNFALFTRLLTTIAIVLAICIFVFSDYVIPILFGTKFESSIEIIKILSVAVVFSYLRNMYSSFNNAHNKVKLNIYGNFIGLIFTLVLDILLIPKYGIVGAAYASLTAYLASYIFIFITVLKQIDDPFHNCLIILPKDIKIIKSLLP
ncbi:MAG: oligosaccharide flippase family protein [Ignavibacteriae bacterium]|nr:oligosaccharide flippase family protein [Ignavibacteriota bacterium]